MLSFTYTTTNRDEALQYTASAKRLILFEVRGNFYACNIGKITVDKNFLILEMGTQFRVISAVDNIDYVYIIFEASSKYIACQYTKKMNSPLPGGYAVSFDLDKMQSIYTSKAAGEKTTEDPRSNPDPKSIEWTQQHRL